jgi:hypothetical protein
MELRVGDLLCSWAGGTSTIVGASSGVWMDAFRSRTKPTHLGTSLTILTIVRNQIQIHLQLQL